MHIRICMDLHGSISYHAWDFSKSEYYPLDPEYAVACFNKSEGTDPITSIEFASSAYESFPCEMMV